MSFFIMEWDLRLLLKLNIAEGLGLLLFDMLEGALSILRLSGKSVAIGKGLSIDPSLTLVLLRSNYVFFALILF